MNAEPQKYEESELHEKMQSGQLIIGLSSAIPGFIRKNPSHNVISFAPFFARDSWVDLPIAIVQELVPTPNGKPKEHLPLSFALKPGGKKEQVLIDIIDALTHAPLAKANGSRTAKANTALPVNSSENGMCRRCAMGDEFCVDCYL